MKRNENSRVLQKETRKIWIRMFFPGIGYLYFSDCIPTDFLGDAMTKFVWRIFEDSYNKEYMLKALNTYDFNVESHNRKGLFVKQRQKDCFDLLCIKLSAFRMIKDEGRRVIRIRTSIRDNEAKLSDGPLIKLLAWNQQCNINTYYRMNKLCYHHLCHDEYNDDVRPLLLYMWYCWGKTYFLLSLTNQTFRRRCINIPTDLVRYIASFIKTLYCTEPITLHPHVLTEKERFYVLPNDIIPRIA